MIPIVVGGDGDGDDGDVAAYQYIAKSETFTLHNMKHSSHTSSFEFHSLTFTLSLSSNATEYISFPWSWISHTVFQNKHYNFINSFSTVFNISKFCAELYEKQSYVHGMLVFVTLKHWSSYDMIDNLLTITCWTIN